LSVGPSPISSTLNSAWSSVSSKVLYKIATKKRATIEKNVEVFNVDKLRVNENVTFQLCPSDLLVFTHKQYKIGESGPDGLMNIKKGGSGYKKGDILIPANLVAKYNTFDDTELHAEFRVEEIGEGPTDNVVSLKKIKDGIYNSIPSKGSDFSGGSVEVELGGGFGTGLVIDGNIELLSEAFNEERIITDIETDISPNGEAYSILYLNNPLPPKILKGKIKIEKWSIFLNVNNDGPPKINVPYTMIKDFTPNSGLPLLMGDVHNSKTLYNESMFVIDQKIKELEARIEAIAVGVDELITKHGNFEDSVLTTVNSNREDLEDLKTKYDQIGEVYIETGEKTKASLIAIGGQIDAVTIQLNEIKDASNL